MSATQNAMNLNNPVQSSDKEMYAYHHPHHTAIPSNPSAKSVHMSRSEVYAKLTSEINRVMIS